MASVQIKANDSASAAAVKVVKGGKPTLAPDAAITMSFLEQSAIDSATGSRARRRTFHAGRACKGRRRRLEPKDDDETNYMVLHHRENGTGDTASAAVGGIHQVQRRFGAGLLRLVAATFRD